MKKNGFTLIEILISITILALLLGISISVFRAITVKQGFDRDVEVATSYLLEARNRTITGDGGINYGVHFASTSVTLFYGTTYNAASSTNRTFSFNNRTYMHAIGLTSGTFDIYFKKISGAPSATGTITYKATDSSPYQKLINIHGSGLVEVQLQ